MHLSDEEIQKLTKLTEKYIKAKSLILYCEEIDENSSANLQIIKELRDAFDHTMVVLANKMGLTGNSYIIINLEKAIGHVYRAAFDALDGSVISLKNSITTELEGYEIETIKEVIPNYFEIKKDINAISEKIAEHRTTKDTSKTTDELFDKYVEDLEDLKNIYDSILNYGPEIERYSKEKAKNKRKEIYIKVFISLISIVAGSLITYFIFGIH